MAAATEMQAHATPEVHLESAVPSHAQTLEHFQRFASVTDITARKLMDGVRKCIDDATDQSTLNLIECLMHKYQPNNLPAFRKRILSFDPALVPKNPFLPKGLQRFIEEKRAMMSGQVVCKSGAAASVPRKRRAKAGAHSSVGPSAEPSVEVSGDPAVKRPKKRSAKGGDHSSVEPSQPSVPPVERAMCSIPSIEPSGPSVPPIEPSGPSVPSVEPSAPSVEQPDPGDDATALAMGLRKEAGIAWMEQAGLVGGCGKIRDDKQYMDAIKQFGSLEKLEEMMRL